MRALRYIPLPLLGILVVWMFFISFGQIVLTIVLAVSTALIFARLVRGPRLADRVIALDVITLVGVGIIAIQSINNNQIVYLDVAVVLGLTAFLAIVAFAKYIEKRAIDKRIDSSQQAITQKEEPDATL